MELGSTISMANIPSRTAVFPRLLGFLVLVLVSGLVAASSPSELFGGSQYIFYNGTLGGSLTTTNTSCGDNGTYYFADIADTSIDIGINPAWDPNPFYFYLKHSAHGTSAGPDGYDSIDNFHFASAWYLCYTRPGRRCGLFDRNPYYYVTATMLDLYRTTISATDSQSGPGYWIRGGQPTWVSNGTTTNDLLFRIGKNYSSQTEVDCPLAMNNTRFVW